MVPLFSVFLFKKIGTLHMETAKVIEKWSKTTDFLVTIISNMGDVIYSVQLTRYVYCYSNISEKLLVLKS